MDKLYDGPSMMPVALYVISRRLLSENVNKGKASAIIA